MYPLAMDRLSRVSPEDQPESPVTTLDPRGLYPVTMRPSFRIAQESEHKGVESSAPSPQSGPATPSSATVRPPPFDRILSMATVYGPESEPKTPPKKKTSESPTRGCCWCCASWTHSSA